MGSGPLRLRINLLGGFGVEVDGADAAAPWRLRKAKTLVKLLALAPGHQQHREVLVEELWPDLAPDAGANNFHQVLHAARRVIGADRIVLRDDVLLLADDVTIDLDEFHAAAAHALATRKAGDLRAALAWWRGELLPEDRYEDWTTADRDRADAVRTTIAAELGAVLVEHGNVDEALAVLEPIAADRPLDERVHRSLLVALAAAGRRADAATAFDALRDALRDELGVEPERETRAVFRRLFVGGTPDADAAPHNLPTLATSFIGRERQLVELEQLLERTRLLTLVGPGGAGKTRLAVELAHRQLTNPQWADGVWLAELAGVTSTAGVPSAVASALRLQLPGDRPWVPAIVEQLARRSLLLVLDNCEHVLDAIAPLVAEVLARCPDVEVLATSREPLGHTGEVAWRVPSLELPRPDDAAPDELARFESVQLFVERAHSSAPGFVLDATTAPAVAEICRRLDGIPLALELAAVRVAHMSVAQLATRLGDALVVLTRRGGGAPDRQQTLAATLAWSHDLLLEDERVVFRRLAVFANGFDLDAATAVCALPDVVDVLSRLVDKSLVVADTSGAAARYRVIEVVRQYAELRLREAGEEDACRQRHREWYAAEALAHDPDRGVPVALEPPPWFDVEQDNVRAAVASALDDDPGLALQLATSSWRALLARGQIAEGLTRLTAALDGHRDVSPLRLRALFGAGVLEVRSGNLDHVASVAAAMTEDARALGDDRLTAEVLDQQAIFTLMAHDLDRAREHSAGAVALAGDDPTIDACARHFGAVLALGIGEAAQALDLLDLAEDALGRVPAGTAPFFTALTVCWVVDDQPSPPVAMSEESMVLGRRVGAAQARAYVGVAAAVAHRIAGRADDAIARLDDAIARFTDVEDVYGLSYALCQRGHTLRWHGDLDAALVCFEEAEERRRAQRDLRAIAVTLIGRAYTEALLDDAGSARGHVREAIAMMRRTGDRPGVALTLHVAALIAEHFELPEIALPRAEECLAMADDVAPLWGIGWQHLMVARLRNALGDPTGSARAAGDAAACFAAVGDRRGERALQSARKDGTVTMPS